MPSWYASSQRTAAQSVRPPWGTDKETQDDKISRLSGNITTRSGVSAPWDAPSGAFASGRKHTTLTVDHDTCPWGPAHPEWYGKGKRVVLVAERTPCPFATENDKLPTAAVEMPPAPPTEEAEKEEDDGIPTTLQALEAFKTRVTDEMLEMGRSEDDIMAALEYADSKFNEKQKRLKIAAERAADYVNRCDAAKATRAKSSGAGVAGIFTGRM